MEEKEMEKDLFMLINERLPKLSKGHKLIANFILSHYDKAAFMTAQKLGITVGVSESTVVRFATELGYDGYPALQRALQGLMRNKLTAVQRIEVMNDRLTRDDVLERVLTLDIEKIRRTLEETSTEDFNRAVDMITSCNTIYILAARSTAPLASFMSYYFNLIFPKVRLVHNSSTSEMFEQIMHIDENDVLIGISFPRYSKQTVKGLQFAKSKGTHVIALTDSISSPLAQFADTLLLAHSDMASFVDSLVAPLSLINALIVAVSITDIDRVSKNFESLEQIWEEYDVYEKSDNSDGPLKP